MNRRKAPAINDDERAKRAQFTGAKPGELVMSAAQGAPVDVEFECGNCGKLLGQLPPGYVMRVAAQCGACGSWCAVDWPTK